LFVAFALLCLLVRRLSRDNIHAAAIHGNKSQPQRTKALASFKQNKIQVLVATDIAARGIDIDQLSHVVNFDLPNVPEDYIHRIGRTGRAGASGEAISLVSADEIKQLQDIERLMKRKIERVEIDDFETGHIVPESKPAPHKHQRKKVGKKTGKRSVSNDRHTHSRHGKANSTTKRNSKPHNHSRRSGSNVARAV